MKDFFASPNLYTVGWIYACRLKDLSQTSLCVITRNGQRLVLWLGIDESPRAAFARCPHLGACLSSGDVVDGKIQCGLHHRQFAETELETLETAYCAGAVFLFWGESKGDQLPTPPWDKGISHCSKEEVLACHPHIATINGVDIEHIQPVHGVAASLVEPLTLKETHRASFVVAFTKTSALRWVPKTVTSTFTIHHGSCCEILSESSIGRTWHLLNNFAYSNGSYGTVDIQSVEPRYFGFNKIIAWMDRIILRKFLQQDRAVLSNMQWNYEQVLDEPLADLVEMISSVPSWDGKKCPLTHHEK